MSVQSTSAPSQPPSWSERAEELFVRTYTGSCNSFCVENMTETCKAQFEQEGVKSLGTKCMNVWERCMKHCVCLGFKSQLID